jgi:cobalt/nickel transport protein
VSRVPTRAVVLGGLLLALLLAGVVSYYASHQPDGLAKVSRDHGFSQSAQEHRAADGPFAGYHTKGIADGRISQGVAGVAGSLVVLTLAGGGALLVRRRRTTEQS